MSSKKEGRAMGPDLG